MQTPSPEITRASSGVTVRGKKNPKNPKAQTPGWDDPPKNTYQLLQVRGTRAGMFESARNEGWEQALGWKPCKHRAGGAGTAPPPRWDWEHWWDTHTELGQGSTGLGRGGEEPVVDVGHKSEPGVVG